ncbi:uncharacterized protein BKCO1_1100078 [Diplodia corticola]|uniref:Uncharacterized protein n=1 Tax=Diplodia corticola TaxID=236234 RepID=A0A1J9RUY9_9PEZI|nr:uncharacterized protein BKCO1_1100078 [Diplodia corticola]OJD36403.1 hypothetical protein BKCO1_1100078 [Diplodia corticola]
MKGNMVIFLALIGSIIAAGITCAPGYVPAVAAAATSSSATARRPCPTRAAESALYSRETRRQRSKTASP